MHQRLTEINWGAGRLFLMVEIDIKSRGNFKVMGVQQMMAVPFAFHSLSSSTVKYDDILNVPQLSAVATTGNYSDLINTPSVFNGDYNELTNKPVIPAKPVSSLTMPDLLIIIMKLIRHGELHCHIIIPKKT